MVVKMLAMRVKFFYLTLFFLCLFRIIETSHCIMVSMCRRNVHIIACEWKCFPCVENEKKKKCRERQTHEARVRLLIRLLVHKLPVFVRNSKYTSWVHKMWLNFLIAHCSFNVYVCILVWGAFLMPCNKENSPSSREILTLPTPILCLLNECCTKCSNSHLCSLSERCSHMNLFSCWCVFNILIHQYDMITVGMMSRSINFYIYLGK